jgi:hypothetical protein
MIGFSEGNGIMRAGLAIVNGGRKIILAHAGGGGTDHPGLVA